MLDRVVNKLLLNLILTSSTQYSIPSELLRVYKKGVHVVYPFFKIVIVSF